MRMRNNDTEMLDRLDVMYLETMERVKEAGFNLAEVVTVDEIRTKIYPTLEQEAWLVWIGEREKHVGSETLRPAPEVEDIYAEPAA